MNPRIFALAPTFLAVVLSACGGGSSGSGPAQTTPPPAAQITKANAPMVAGSAANAALQSGDAKRFGAPDTSLFGFSAKTAAPAMAKALRKVPVGPQTLPCTNGGSVTVSGDVASFDILTTGDTLTIDFDQCVEGEESIDGGVSMVVDLFQGSLVDQLYVISASTTFDALSATSPRGSAALDGDVTVRIDTESPPITTATVSGDQLTIGVDEKSLSLSNFNTQSTLDESSFPTAYTLDASGALMSSEFAGEVTYENVVPFSGSGDDYPSAGEFLVTDSDSRSVRLFALDSVNVRLDIDSDGDGAVDDTIDTTWDEIL